MPRNPFPKRKKHPPTMKIHGKIYVHFTPQEILADPVYKYLKMGIAEAENELKQMSKDLDRFEILNALLINRRRSLKELKENVMLVDNYMMYFELAKKMFH